MYDIKKISVLYDKIQKLNNLQKLIYSIEEEAENIIYLIAKNNDNKILCIKVFSNLNEIYLYLSGIIDGYELKQYIK